jgi:hypothetical protein
MRTDARFDKRQVICRNSSFLGYSKGTARVGDLVFTKHGLLARMIGRITYAPALEPNDKPIKNWILAVGMVGDLLEHTHERWINPEHVVRVEAIRNQLEVLKYFLSDEMIKAPIEEMRLCCSEGWSTLDAYRAWFKESRNTGAK